MANTAGYEMAAKDVLNFIRETKEGKYTVEKPNLTHITYTRLEIQEGNASNIFDDCPEDVILYGLSS
jgi:hypothetical protein